MNFRRTLHLVSLFWGLRSTASFMVRLPALVYEQDCPLARRDVGSLVMREPVHRRFMNWSQLFMISEGNSEEDDGGESFGEQAMRERMNAELQEIVSSQNIVAFIKGTRLMPQCGYSGTLVNILQSLSVPFETVDVLANDRIRQGIKEFSNWPTIPQLYLAGEFVGGADIVIELFQTGELQEMIEVAAAS
ncbi:unnamed protein product [Ascophyllum nodosum]